MKKEILIKVLAIFLLVLSLCGSVHAAGPDPEVEMILSSAESLFKAMKARNYKGVWDLLTVKSKDEIVKESYKAIARFNAAAKSGNSVSKAEIEADLGSGGIMSKAYWDGYLENFNPDLVLEQSTWTMGKIEGNEAEVVIHYKKAEKPALVQMKKEGGKWKVGLMETFSFSRR